MLLQLYQYNDSNYDYASIAGNGSYNHIINNIKTASSGSITQLWTILIDYINYNNITFKSEYAHSSLSPQLNQNMQSAFLQPSLKENLVGKNLYFMTNTANVTSGSINITIPYTIMSIAFI